MNGHHHDHHHDPGPPGSPPVEEDAPAFHGMLVFGGDPAYLSHLPMPMAEHGYQVLLEGRFEGPGATSPHATYLDAKAASSETVYTFKPRDFVITRLVDPDPSRRVATLTGELVRGHFDGERFHPGHAPHSLIRSVEFRVALVLRFKRLGDATPRGSLSYYLVGRPDQLFLVHRIDDLPSFDQVLAVAKLDPLPELPSQGQPIVVTVQRDDVAAKRLLSRATVPVQLELPGAAEPLTASLTTGAEQYFEEGELTTGDLAQTPRERKAGF